MSEPWRWPPYDLSKLPSTIYDVFERKEANNTRGVKRKISDDVEPDKSQEIENSHDAADTTNSLPNTKRFKGDQDVNAPETPSNTDAQAESAIGSQEIQPVSDNTAYYSSDDSLLSSVPSDFDDEEEEEEEEEEEDNDEEDDQSSEDSEDENDPWVVYFSEDPETLSSGGDYFSDVEYDSENEYYSDDEEDSDISDSQIHIEIDPSRLFPVEGECKVCQEALESPVTLPRCDHSFCSECFIIWARHVRRRRTPVNCPQCRALAL